jgi:hypothetical protein
VCNALEHAIVRYTKQADCKRGNTPTCKVGNKVFLNTRNLQLGQPKRALAKKSPGPYKIAGKVSDLVSQLKLSCKLAKIHHVFYTSLMEPAQPDTIPGRPEAPPGPVAVARPDKCVVESVVALS